MNRIIDYFLPIVGLSSIFGAFVSFLMVIWTGYTIWETLNYTALFVFSTCLWISIIRRVVR